MKKQSGSVSTLCFCVLGLYASFLSWSVLQERINTKPYGYNPDTGKPDFFKAPLIVNIIQAFFAAIVGLVYSLISDKSNPFDIFFQSDKQVSGKFLKSFLIISITSSLSSPLGYQSLKHVDYLAFLLAKSCKLIPVLLIHTTLYRTRFPLYKYLVAGAVSAGVAVFTFGHPSKSESKTSINDGQTLIGMAQLIGSMVLDGLTNSTQDQLFKMPSQVKLTGAKLMCLLNFFMFVLSLTYAYFVEYKGEITYTINFITHYPQALGNILAFAILGSLGQVFVFIILEKFDSLILVTATVTRKMISMILSVILFGHHLSGLQWVGVSLVFTGIGYEAAAKSPKKEVKAQKSKSD
ncbi:UDP-galactose transporter homolog 1 [[Candida] railenensis]|uniref:UDP-galactose transporter homolog 1 n=1 Tax=[Candida] railenensis TaxID=45579 RepID=A0A9P0QT11_9ASCO|nr:UDP-galactose transporter homolog 1 [[Candida] railenensis]